MTARLTARLALVAAPLLAAGCFIDVSEPGDHEANPIDGPCPCEDNLDCESGEYCLRGWCRDIPQGATACSTSAQCDHREMCINGWCTEICAKDSDCSFGGSCEENYCCASGGDGGHHGSDGGTAACSTHAQCGVGAYCINATCYLGCTVDADCPSAESCQAGVCKPKPQNSQPSCTTGAQCVSGEDCVDGRCRAKCTASTSCPPGETCVIGYCTPSTSSGSGQPCAADCECPSGETCQNGACHI